MSSIYGIIFSNRTKSSPEIVEKLKSITGWWNPVNSSHFLSQEVLMGQQNMFVLNDVNGSTHTSIQKLANRIIVADSRIDNKDDIITDLQCSKQLSDSQLILELYRKYEKKCVNYLIGAFSFAIWDDEKKEIFCARDHIGIKPFCYYFKDGLFAFGTQKKSILTIAEVDKSPDWTYILHSISNFGTKSDSTEYKHIKQLLPSHTLTVKRDKIEFHKYWQLDIHKKIKYNNSIEYVENFLFHFKNAIHCRIKDQESFGTHLSGGLDSAGITSVAHSLSKQHRLNHQILSYNIMDELKGDINRFEENLKAFDLIKYLQCEDKFINVNRPIYRTLLSKVKHEVICCDGNSQSNNVNTEFEIQSESNSRQLKILLSGFTGDELVTSFCRPYYLEFFERKEWRKFFFSKKHSRHTFADRIKAFIPAVCIQLIPASKSIFAKQYYRNRYKKYTYRGNSKFLDTDYFMEIPELRQVLSPTITPMSHENFPISLKAYQANHINRSNTSRRIESEQLAGKHWHIEYRYPLADIRLLQYVLSLPMEEKISASMNRKIFRVSMKKYLPDSIRLRDMKHKGSLKPIASFKPKAHKPELIEYLKDVQATGSAPFLNFENVNKWIKSKNNTYSLYQWLILAHLGHEKKMKF